MISDLNNTEITVNFGVMLSYGSQKLLSTKFSSYNVEACIGMNCCFTVTLSAIVI